METEILVWQISFIALAAGVLIGVMGYRFFAPSRKHAEEVQAELEKAREELNQYKVDVGQHFDKTAELVNDLAQKYVNVYQHLADGAQTLGASKSFKELYGQGQGNPSIGFDDRPDMVQAADKDSPEASNDAQADSREATADDDSDSTAPTDDHAVDATDSKRDAAEAAVSAATDDPADGEKATREAEAPEKGVKQ